MRQFLLLLYCLAVLANAATVSKKSVPLNKTVARKTNTTRGRAVSRNASTTRSRGKKGATKVRANAQPSAPPHQNQPTPERYREIQEALAAKGYLKTPPSGAWDADSQDAMRRFQADQELEQTGKLNSLSLIGLGLGPAKPSESAPSPPANR